jgi:hypothetical protein
MACIRTVDKNGFASAACSEHVACKTVVVAVVYVDCVAAGSPGSGGNIGERVWAGIVGEIDCIIAV